MRQVVSRGRWFVLLGVALVLSQHCAAAAGQTWALDYPRGGEVLISGSTQMVIVSGKVSATPVVALVQGSGAGAVVTTLSGVTVNKKVMAPLSYTVPATVGTNYTVRVTVAVKGGATQEADSAPFSIVDGSLFTGGSTATLAGDVNGPLNANVIGAGAVTKAKIGSGTAANLDVLIADGAGNTEWGTPTAANEANALIRRDATGSASVQNLTANGNVTAGGTVATTGQVSAVTGTPVVTDTSAASTAVYVFSQQDTPLRVVVGLNNNQDLAQFVGEINFLGDKVIYPWASIDRLGEGHFAGGVQVSGGATITSGDGAPTSTANIGDMYLQLDVTGANSPLWVYYNGAWHEK